MEIVRRFPAVELANTLRHDGAGGVTDDLSTRAATARWLRERHDLLPAELPGIDETLHTRLVALRGAVRALFARAVEPGPPSPVDARSPMPVDEALTRLNAAADTDPVVPELDWLPGAAPVTRVRSTGSDPRTRPVAALARAAIEFLGGPDRERLRACNAPRCVRYFVQGHGRQQWCKPSCGNRARVARHHRRRQATQ